MSADQAPELAGIGKTELVRHARETAVPAGMQVCTARGAELERDASISVVRQLLEGGVWAPAWAGGPVDRVRS